MPHPLLSKSRPAVATGKRLGESWHYVQFWGSTSSDLWGPVAFTAKKDQHLAQSVSTIIVDPLGGATSTVGVNKMLTQSPVWYCCGTVAVLLRYCFGTATILLQHCYGTVMVRSGYGSVRFKTAIHCAHSIPHVHVRGLVGASCPLWERADLDSYPG